MIFKKRRINAKEKNKNRIIFGFEMFAEWRLF